LRRNGFRGVVGRFPGRGRIETSLLGRRRSSIAGMSDNNREERAPMVSQAMENVRRSGALSRRPGARRHRWTLAAPGSGEGSAESPSESPSENPPENAAEHGPGGGGSAEGPAENRRAASDHAAPAETETGG